MFTFGREHEKKHAIRHITNQAQVGLVIDIIDAVHNLIEGTGSEPELMNKLRAGIVQGGSGVWEQSTSWLRKSAAEHRDLLALWLELSNHPEAKVRFKVACCLTEMPAAVAAPIGQRLQEDPSKKVRAMASARLEEMAASGAT